MEEGRKGHYILKYSFEGLLPDAGDAEYHVQHLHHL
jgi:hypothetical protein